MIKYAGARGLPMPADALKIVDQARQQAHISVECDPGTAGPHTPPTTRGTSSTGTGTGSTGTGSASGPVATDPNLKAAGPAATDGPDLARLAAAHAKLAAVVAPATPNTILVITDASSTRREWVRGFGATTYARWLFLVAVITVVIFVVVLLIAQGNDPPEVAQFLLTVTAALVGSVLYVMFNVSRLVRTASIDRTQEGVYTAHLVLGVLSGTALAFLVVQPAEMQSNGSDGTSSVQVLLTRPLIALLGGFAVEAVYRILQRLVTTLEALVRGSEDELVQAQAHGGVLAEHLAGSVAPRRTPPLR